jgi:hypothetical protein
MRPSAIHAPTPENSLQKDRAGWREDRAGSIFLLVALPLRGRHGAQVAIDLFPRRLAHGVQNRGGLRVESDGLARGSQGGGVGGFANLASGEASGVQLA